jgi:hypothetical protein
MARLACLALVLSGVALVAAAPRGGGGPPSVFQTAVPAHAVDVILVRPGADRVTLSVLAYVNTTAAVAYGPTPGALTQHTEDMAFAAGEPRGIELTGLKADTAYAYELKSPTAALVRGTFHTQRRVGSPFTFTITADSHLDQGTDPRLYETTLANAAADKPDFNVDLGDTFMTEKYLGDFHQAHAQYLAQRYYFSQLCRSAPLFLTLGNHDGELGWLLDDADSNIVTWSCGRRKTYFPMPEPGGVYSGNEQAERLVGRPQNYYAWEWGDALCVVLDPFWPTRSKPRPGDGCWSRTLGERQYRWLQQTLAGSWARYKFVFIHHLVGGADKDARGGIEAAPFFEWGGRNADGSDGFAQHRPGWERPIHQLLRDYGVTAVFHGHDHFFARQELDGIAYQLVPQPDHRGFDLNNSVQEYGYRAGTILPGSGHLRVAVSASGARVEFVQAVAPADERPGRENGRAVCSYALTHQRGAY